MRPSRFTRAAALLGALALVALSASPARAADKAKLLGGGSSFSYLLIDQWRADTESKPYSLDVNYQQTGSSQGRQAFWQRTVDFAMSDIPYQPEEASAGQTPASGSFRYITLVAGALGMMFNLTDDSGNQVTDLRLDPTTVCRIFTEKLSKPMYWDDPQIQNLNPDVFLPHTEINPVVRSDGSGTSYVLSEYCIATAPDVWAAFKAKAMSDQSTASPAMQAGRPVSNWPTGGRYTAAPQSTGIANSVSASPGSITYIEAGYAEITGLPLATVRNAAGVFVPPTPPGITTALKYATIQADGTFKLNFQATDPAAYFPSTYSYLIVPTSGLDAGKARTLSEYVYYALTVGQDQCEPLEFARLSPNLIDDGIAAVAALPGATPVEEWKAAVGVVASSGGGGSTGGGSTGGSTGGGSTGGGSTGGGVSTGGGSTGDGSTGGGSTGGGSTGGGSTGGGSTGDGSTGGGSTGGGSTGGGSTGGDTGGGSTGGGSTADPAATPSASTPGGAPVAGATTTVKGRAAGSTGGSSGGSAAKGSNEAAAPASGGGTQSTALAATRKAPGPSNAEVVWTMLQGAAILGAGLLLHRTVSGASR